jgi:hypothetical protein
MKKIMISIAILSVYSLSADIKTEIDRVAGESFFKNENLRQAAKLFLETSGLQAQELISRVQCFFTDQDLQVKEVGSRLDKTLDEIDNLKKSIDKDLLNPSGQQVVENLLAMKDNKKEVQEYLQTLVDNHKRAQAARETAAKLGNEFAEDCVAAIPIVSSFIQTIFKTEHPKCNGVLALQS